MGEAGAARYADDGSQSSSDKESRMNSINPEVLQFDTVSVLNTREQFESSEKS